MSCGRDEYTSVGNQGANTAMLGRPSGRNTLAFTDLIDLWTWLVVVFVSLMGLGRPSIYLFSLKRLSPAILLVGPRVAVPTILCLLAMHWLLLWRVLRRRRWACLFSSLYGWLFFHPHWGHAGWWSVLGAGLLSMLAVSVVLGWRDLTDGW